MRKKKSSDSQKTEVTLHDILRSVDGIGDRVGRIEDDLVSLGHTVNAGFERLDAKVDAVDAKVDAVDAKVDAVDAKVEKLDKKVERQYTELKGRDRKHDERLTKLEQTPRRARG